MNPFFLKRYKATILLNLLIIVPGANSFLFAQPDYHYFIESKYKLETYGIGSSTLSQQLTYIGLYKESLIEEERYQHSPFLKSKIVQSDFHQENAYPYIFNAIKNNRIVILNETHNNPLSRVLLYNIIDSLEKYDVKAVFMEALGYDPTDTNFVSAKQPFAYGIYTCENVFRQVLYKFRDNKLNLYSYEYQYKDLDTLTINGNKCIVSKNDARWAPVPVDAYVLDNFLSKDEGKEREAHQAIRIFQKLQRDHIDKAFIYCGYGHAWRQGRNMIDILEHLLGQDLYSIDQTLMNECVNKNLESPYYTQFAKDHPFVIVDQQKVPISTVADNGQRPIVNLIVGSPRSIYINNRPTWLELNGNRKRYHLSQFIENDAQKDFLVACYTLDELKTDKEEHIPDDAFQVFGTGQNYDVILKPGQYYQLRLIKNKEIILDKMVFAD